MDREQREPSQKKAAPPRHLDLAWSSPAEPWDTPAPLAAPEGATVPALEWDEQWPPVRAARRPEPARNPGEEQDRAEDLEEEVDSAQPIAEDLEEDEEYWPESDFDDLAEMDELTFPKPPVSRTTWLLAMAALMAIAFGGGILTQKNHDSGLVRPAALAAAQLQQAAAAGAAGPALTGTVVATSPTEITVKDAQGNQHKVAVTDQTAIVKKLTAPGLTNGSQVIVQGTSDDAGTLHASAVVAP